MSIYKAKLKRLSWLIDLQTNYKPHCERFDILDLTNLSIKYDILKLNKTSFKANIINSNQRLPLSLIENKVSISHTNLRKLLFTEIEINNMVISGILKSYKTSGMYIVEVEKLNEEINIFLKIKNILTINKINEIINLMKNLITMCLLLMTLISCNKSVSDKSITEKLTLEELSESIEADSSFADIYDNIRVISDSMSDLQKAKYVNLTYERINNLYTFSKDTVYWKPLGEQWKIEYQNKYSNSVKIADSLIYYYKMLKDTSTLDKYVKVELASINTYYYSYSGVLKDIYLKFKLTPLQGKVDQVTFSYKYKAKINDYYFDEHRCFYSDPMTNSKYGTWDTEYDERNRFAGETVKSFLRDYDLVITVLKVRKDGVNMSIDNLNIPSEITTYLNNDSTTYTYLAELYKADVIKTIDSTYVREWEYTTNKLTEILKAKDPLVYEFLTFKR